MKELYRHLKKYDFGKARRVKQVLTRCSESDISKFLEEYEDIAKQNLSFNAAEPGAIDIFPDSWADPIPEKVIKQLGIYANRIYLHDPMIDMVREWKGLKTDINYIFRYSSLEAKVDAFRAQLEQTIIDLLEIEPLALAGIVQLVPSQLLGPQQSSGTLYASDFYGPYGTGNELLGLDNPFENLPEALRQYSESQLQVFPAKIVNCGTYTLVFLVHIGQLLLIRFKRFHCFFPSIF